MPRVLHTARRIGMCYGYQLIEWYAYARVTVYRASTRFTRIIVVHTYALVRYMGRTRARARVLYITRAGDVCTRTCMGTDGALRILSRK